MDICLPYVSIAGDRTHNADELAAWFATVMTDGVHPSPGTQLSVQVTGAWTLTLQPGRCVIQGHAGTNMSSKTFSVNRATTYARYDYLVMRHDAAQRTIREYIKEGTPSANPSPPALQRDGDAWEIAVARVYVSPEAQQLTQIMVADMRPNNSVCGYINSLIQPDTQTLFEQYEAAWNTWLAGNDTDFHAWFAQLQIDLSGGVAANLSTRITAVETEVSNMSPLGDAVANLSTRTTAVETKVNNLSPLGDAVANLSTRTTAVETKVNNLSTLGDVTAGLSARITAVETKVSNMSAPGELLLNRQFEVHERVTKSFGLSASAFLYGPDRWGGKVVSGSAWLSTVSITTIPNIPKINCLSLYVISGSARLRQVVESIQDGLLSMPLNLSFLLWGAGSYRIGSGGWITKPPGGWTRIVQKGYTGHFDVTLQGAGQWYIADPRLGTADPDAPFAPEDVPATRAACKRYYNKRTNMTCRAYPTLTHLNVNEVYPMAMRTNPTLKFSNLRYWAGANEVTATSITTNAANERGISALNVAGANPALISTGVYLLDYEADAEYYNA